MTLRTHHSRDKRIPFHPLEFSICGFSGVGKTTLIEKLAQQWAQAGHVFSFIKHDAHRFEMDKAGKDTDRIKKAGAHLITINDPRHHALIVETPSSLWDRSYFRSCDFVVLEGHKSFSLPKLILLDESLDILNHLPSPESCRYLGFIGPWENLSPIIQERLSPFNVSYFHRDDVTGIAACVDDFFDSLFGERPLYGLVLAGGRSQRMGQDKALLSYFSSQKPQLRTMVDHLSHACDKVYVSSRSDQAETYQRLTEVDSVIDTFLDLGPLGGILSAMRQHPEAAWLVTAIDLPLLNHKTLGRLIKERDPFRFATTFQTDDGFMEPLCSIYEPKCYAMFLELLGLGFKCPSRMLEHLRVKTLSLGSSAALTNVNTFVEYQNFREPSLL